MRFLFSFIILLIFTSCDGKVSPSKKSNHIHSKQTETRLQSKVAELKKFLVKKKYNQKLAIFIDFKIPSGQKRLFLYDLNKDKIIEEGLVAHGSGSVTDKPNELKFSNINNSYCSSLGKYEVGKSYVGKFGKSYKLYGLDQSNSNALSRAIILHPYQYVPDEEQKSPICLSLGCPMVSPNFFKTLEKYIDGANKNIILYIYY